MQNTKSIDINYLKDYYKEELIFSDDIIEFFTPEIPFVSLYVLSKAKGWGLELDKVDREKFKTVSIYGQKIEYSPNKRAVEEGVSSYTNYKFNLDFWLKEGETFSIEGINDAGFLDFDLVVDSDFEYLAEKLYDDFGIQFMITSGFPESENLGNLMIDINKGLQGKRSLTRNEPI